MCKKSGAGCGEDLLYWTVPGPEPQEPITGDLLPEVGYLQALLGARSDLGVSSCCTPGSMVFFYVLSKTTECGRATLRAVLIGVDLQHDHIEFPHVS